MPTETWPPADHELRAWVSAQHEAHPGAVFPPQQQTFRAFELTPYDAVRVVLLGQDPYPNPGDANGLCFSVTPGQRLPKSMLSIHKALRIDGYEAAPGHGDLTPWAEQGVLLLNTALTVPAGDAGGHLDRWRPFTQSVLAHLDARDRPMVFVLWGAKAKALAQRFVDLERHHPVIAPHPTSYPPTVDEFHNSHSFTRANALLAELGVDGIDWTIR